MTTMTGEFLSKRRIAVAGVSRQPATHGANAVYRRLKERGYEVYAVNPNADKVEGDRAYHDLRSIPDGVDAVVIATAARHSDSIVRDCKALGVSEVWMHAGPGESSVSPTAVDYGRANGMNVIAGGCPLMFDPTADFGHRCIRWVLELRGVVPKGI